MGSPRNLVGKRFGRLTVISDDGKRTAKNVIMWHCICDCGNHKYIPTTYLTSGDTQSCGCLFEEVSRRSKNFRHGDSRNSGEYNRLYMTWVNMKRRCDDPNCASYSDYGGRGISVCDAWYDYETFKEWALINGYTNNLTIDRINVNGNYEPSNCRWADNITQGNNRRTNRYIEYNDEIRTVAEWSRITGIREDTILHRLKYGWDVKDALSTPTRFRSPSTPDIEYLGETHSIAEWSRIVGISYTALVQRLRDGWNIEDALTVPVKPVSRIKK